MNTGCKQRFQHFVRNLFIACRQRKSRSNFQDLHSIDHDRKFFSKSARKNHKTGSMASNRDQTDVLFNTTPRKEKILIVGLGNYDRLKTRHSVGMQMVKILASKLDLEWKRDTKLCGGYTASSHVSAFTQIYLLNPSEPMNLNGKSVVKAVRNLKISRQNVFLIQDDLDRPLGKVVVKEKGSASGHNGVRSVCSSLQTEEIPRIKIGIGRPLSQDFVSEYVLKKFDSDELEQVDCSIKEAIEKLVDILFQRGFELGSLLEFYNPVELPVKKRRKKPKKKLRTNEVLSDVNMAFEHSVSEQVIKKNSDSKDCDSGKNSVPNNYTTEEKEFASLQNEIAQEFPKVDNSDSEGVDR